MPHILLIEDDPAIATTLRYALEREHWQVDWLDTAGQVLPWLMNAGKLDAIVMDVGLPDGNGFELCQAIRFGQHHTNVPILFLTARDDEIDKIIGLEMGADDYITKPFSPREIVARLKAIWRREQRQAVNLAEKFGGKWAQANTPVSKNVSPNTLAEVSATPWTAAATSVHVTQDFEKTLPTGQWHYQDSIYQLHWNGHALPLSKTELGIMLALLAQPSHILSRDQILAAISDYPEHRLARTIDSHIKTLRQKLAEIDPNGEVIVTHRGLGYGLNRYVEK